MIFSSTMNYCLNMLGMVLLIFFKNCQDEIQINLNHSIFPLYNGRQGSRMLHHVMTIWAMEGGQRGAGDGGRRWLLVLEGS